MRSADRAGEAFDHVLARSRLLVLVPVVVFVAALGAFVYGTVVFVDGVRTVVDHPIPVGNKIGLFLVVIDLFLIGATLLIAAIGFYELFVSRVDVGNDTRMVPQWLAMRDLNDLKVRIATATTDVGVTPARGRDPRPSGAAGRAAGVTRGSGTSPPGRQRPERRRCAGRG